MENDPNRNEKSRNTLVMYLLLFSLIRIQFPLMEIDPHEEKQYNRRQLQEKKSRTNAAILCLLPRLDVQNVVLIHMYAAIIHDNFIVNTHYPYLYKHQFWEHINMKRDNIRKCNMNIENTVALYFISKKFLDVSIKFLHYNFEAPKSQNVDVSML